MPGSAFLFPVRRDSAGFGCGIGTPDSASTTLGFPSMLRVAALVIWTLKSLVEPEGVAAISLAPVNWNSSNPMFKSSKNDHVIEVKPYDDLDLVCPYWPRSEEDEDDDEEDEVIEKEEKNAYYIIYMVSKMEYDDCNIYSESQVVMMLNCSNPRNRKRFTILFEPFPSIPNVPEYQPGSSYYFITTSTGTKDGLGNLYQGACSHHNMKLTIKICCDNNASKHTNAILPESTSSHQRKNQPHHHHSGDHAHRPHAHDSPNRRRSRIHGQADEHNGKGQRSGAHASTTSLVPTHPKGEIPARTYDSRHHKPTHTQEVVHNPVRDALQDSWVYSGSSSLSSSFCVICCVSSALSLLQSLRCIIRIL